MSLNLLELYAVYNFKLFPAVQVYFVIFRLSPAEILISAEWFLLSESVTYKARSEFQFHSINIVQLETI